METEQCIFFFVLIFYSKIHYLFVVFSTKFYLQFNNSIKFTFVRNVAPFAVSESGENPI